MLIYGSVLSVPVYAMSHETAHGTAFRTRWLNETVMWICALLYLEEPLHRRYTHTNHHTYTWHVGKDSQMPFDTPMTLPVWIMEISGFSLTRFHIHRLIQLAAGHYTETLKSVVPKMNSPDSDGTPGAFSVFIFLLAQPLASVKRGYGGFWYCLYY